MDHDAMWTHVQKLMKFRDDFLVLSKVTADQFHAMAEAVRAGKDPMDVVRGRDEVAEFDIKAGDIDDDPEPLGTDKSDGTVKRDGQELPQTKVEDTGGDTGGQPGDEGDASLDGPLPGDGSEHSQQTADLSGAGAPQSEDGAKAPAAPKNAQAGSAEAATGV
jgi:hypothetical protein